MLVGMLHRFPTHREAVVPPLQLVVASDPKAQVSLAGYCYLCRSLQTQLSFESRTLCFGVSLLHILRTSNRDLLVYSDKQQMTRSAEQRKVGQPQALRYFRVEV